MVMCSCICKRESALITNFSTKHDAHNAVQLVDWLTRITLKRYEFSVHKGVNQPFRDCSCLFKIGLFFIQSHVNIMLINDLYINIIVTNLWLLIVNHIGLLQRSICALFGCTTSLFRSMLLLMAKPAHYLHEVGLIDRLQTQQFGAIVISNTFGWSRIGSLEQSTNGWSAFSANMIFLLLMILSVVAWNHW